ncbi:hypothetical protein AFCA_005522 [Aspergillus flavus]|uniref:Uncharacterized protein n=1 Tax=Aspergillus flavus TaxID=5059 RepID=A0AB74BSU5_ASPFL|nr:hypothetical protein COH21_000348 [Aspergillus flavus]RAQ76026.1 hypothetical protein COH20_001785 [Aspergillus flavus]RMZ36297.1 hypothetical protein CA14_005722 [Aspergillus flavus]UDD58050.1 hypothetical protein AFCA_005522 [Aspergillus flavus]
MSQRSSIKNYFKRPDFSASRDSRYQDPSETPAESSQSSPLTEPPSSFVTNGGSPQTPDGPALQLKQSLLLSVTDSTENSQHQPSSQNTEPAASDPTLPPSFNLAQRVVRNGREVVISSDGEDTDTSEAFEDPTSLFLKFAKPDDTSTNEETNNDSSSHGRTLRSRPSRDDVKPRRFSLSRVSAPNYKHSIDSLVTQAVDDNETEASIAKLRATLEEENARKAASKSEAAPGLQQLHEGILTSALDSQNDETGLRRLLDAVRRTEAFDMEKSWFFFDHGSELAPPPAFPRNCIPAKSSLSVLRDPESRERAFHSGSVDFALSRGLLPDELVVWILNSVPSEPRDTLRNAYCRAFKNTTAERIQSLVRPDSIDAIFQRMGASPKALTFSEVIVPDAIPKNSPLRAAPQHQAALLAILNLLRGAADLFSDETREHILSILFRLSLDISLTRDPMVCSELERTIIAVLESIPEETADNLVYRVCTSAYETIKDAVFQSRLLTHILPTSSWIAMLRCRLAVAFLTSDPSSLAEEPDVMGYLRRIIDVLKDKRFDVKRYKMKGQPEYDYGELMAITTVLNIAIDSGWSGVDFSSKDAEREFNSEVDALADRIKRIFTSIEDSGASHLKRTLAKEALEALHYRIIYSVRTKPRPKRSIFGENGADSQNKKVFDPWKIKIKQDPETPTQQPEASP